MRKAKMAGICGTQDPRKRATQREFQKSAGSPFESLAEYQSMYTQGEILAARKKQLSKREHFPGLEIIWAPSCQSR